MKKYIVFFVFINYFSAFSQSTLQLFTISSPIDRSVYQRNGKFNNSTSKVTFTGQITESTTTSNNARIEIKRLSLNGSVVGDYIASRVFSSTERTKIGTSVGYTYYLTLTIPTGWYQLNVKNGSDATIKSVKFGVGEVFVIAGQSNAMGFGQDVYNVVSGLQNYDCVSSLKNIQAIDNTEGGYAYVTDFVNIEKPVFGVLNYTNPNIGPNGTRPWFYQKLGEIIAGYHTPANTIVTNLNYTTYPPVPTVFFNVASAGTSINNWEGASLKTAGMFSNNYSSPMVPSNGSITPSIHPIVHPWGYGVNYSSLFTNLKNILSFYGGMYGVRAVLWHQGEAETKTLTITVSNPQPYIPSADWTGRPNPYSVTDYDTKLKGIMNNSRIILPGLNWGISKVSLTSEAYKTPPNATTPRNLNMLTPLIITEQSSLVNSSNPYIGWFTQNSDTYTAPIDRNVNDGTHFNQSGLEKMAFNASTNIVITIFNKVPTAPVPLPKLSLTKISNGNYTVTVVPPSGVSYVHTQWNSAVFGVAYNQANTANVVSSTTLPTAGPITGFTKDSQGRISIIPIVGIQNLTGARKALTEELTSIIYPNPVNDNSDLTIEYEAVEGHATIEIYDKNEKLIYSYEKQDSQMGKSSHVISNEVFKNTEDLEFLYVIIKSGEQVSKKKIIIQK